jgi:hypothetical protein
MEFFARIGFYLTLPKLQMVVFSQDENGSASAPGKDVKSGRELEHRLGIGPRGGRDGLKFFLPPFWRVEIEEVLREAAADSQQKAIRRGG